MKPLEETILLYQGPRSDIGKAYHDFCKSQKIRFCDVRQEQYDMPLGLVAFGDEAQQKEYLRKEEGKKIGGTMMVLAGFTRERLMHILDEMKQNALPYVPLKAMLTEHNAVWDSLYLYEHLMEEHAMMKQMQQRGMTNKEE